MNISLITICKFVKKFYRTFLEKHDFTGFTYFILLYYLLFYKII